MNLFQDSEIQSQLRQLTRKFAETKLKPAIESDEHSENFRTEFIEELGQLGLTGVPVPETYGGAGLGYSEYCTVIEELARVHCTYAISVAVTGLPQIILNDSGSETQKHKFIPPLAAGKAIGAFGLSEASSGSDAGSLRTTARKEGSFYFLNGTKLWITQGDIASTLIIMARTGAEGPKGVSAFIVEKNTPGFKLGKREKKMGLKNSHTMELVFENCIIPEENLIGKEGDGFKVAMNALNGGRITIAAAALGLAKGAYEAALSHAKEREQFGKSIGEFQGVGFMLAEMRTLIDASDLLIRKAAHLKDQGEPYALEASQAKFFTTDAAMKITTDAVQILGGSGYTEEFPVERYMREAKVLQIVEGTNQIQRHLISKMILK